MTVHLCIAQYGYALDEISCGGPSWRLPANEKTIQMDMVTCHKCLEEVVREGDRATEYLIALDARAGEAPTGPGPRCVKCGPVKIERVYEAEGGGHGHTGCWQRVELS